MANINEIKAILYRASKLYPRLELGELDETAAAWLKLLRGFDKKTLEDALDKYAGESNRAPHVSDIRKLCERKQPRGREMRSAKAELESLRFTKALGLKRVTDLFVKDEFGKNLSYLDKVLPDYHCQIRAKNGKRYTIKKIDYIMRAYGPRQVNKWLRSEFTDFREVSSNRKAAITYRDWLSTTFEAAKKTQKQVMEVF